jgi:asparagine synthetase B (glutamine-hydrolysing)
MCGIAGIIHRDGPGDIGSEMTRMLQSMKHRGPDSSGFALYGPPGDLLVMRVKLADPNSERGFGWAERLERYRNEIEARLAKLGAVIDSMHGDQDYAYRVQFLTPVISSRSRTTSRTYPAARCSRSGTRWRSSRT